MYRGRQLFLTILIFAVFLTPFHVMAQIITDPEITAFEDLPVGYIELTSAQDGNISLTVRCAPTAQVLNAIAQKCGIKLEYKAAPNNYVSISTRSKSPAEMIDDVCTFTGLVYVEENNGFMSISAPMTDPYDPTASEEAILANYSPVQETRSSQGINNGVLVWNGQILRRPYKVEAVDNGDGTASVKVNGVILSTTYDVESFGNIMDACIHYKPVSAPDDYNPKDLAFMATGVYIRARESGCSHEEAFTKVKEFIETQPALEVVIFDPDNNKLRIAGSYQGSHFMKSSPVLMINVLGLYEGGMRPSKKPVVISRKAIEPAKEAAEILGEELSLNLFTAKTSKGIAISFGNNSASKLLCQAVISAGNLSVGQVECLITEIIQERFAARTMAMGIKNDNKAYIEELSGMVNNTPAN